MPRRGSHAPCVRGGACVRSWGGGGERPAWGLFAQWHDLIDRGDPLFTFWRPCSRWPTAGPAGERRRRQPLEHERHYSSTRCATPPDPMRGCGAGGSRSASSSRGASRSVAPRSPAATSRSCDCARRPPADGLDRRLVLVGDSTGETVWTSTDPGVVGAGSASTNGCGTRPSRPCPRGSRRRSRLAWSTSPSGSSTEPPTARSPGPWESPSARCRPTSVRWRSGSGARSPAHAIALISGVDG